MWNGISACAEGTIYDDWDDNAPVVNVNEDVSISFHKWYRIVIPEDGIIDIDYNYVSDNRNHPTTIWLEKKQRESFYTRDSNTRDVDTGGRWGIKAGTYYLYVKACGLCRGDEKNCIMRFNYSQSDGWEKEPNNKEDEATELKMGVPVHGSGISILKIYDPDYYKFTIDKPGSVSFNLNMKDVSNVNDFSLELYDSEKNFLYDLNRECKTDRCNSPSVGIKAGTYYLIVSTGRKDREDYILNVNYVENDITVETESNNDLSLADNIVGNVTKNAFMSENDIDCYSFSADSDRYMKLSIKMESFDLPAGTYTSCPSAFWEICVYNEEKMLIKKYLERLSYGKYLLEKEVGYIEMGKYYIVMRPYDWDGYVEQEQYSLTVSDYIPKVSKAKINNLFSPSKKKIQIKWKSLEGVNGYEIAIATNKKFTKNLKKIVVGSGKDTCVFKKLKRKKKYYVRMRAYLDYDGNRHYGKYSNVKTIKVK
jgi:hypothetical protein